MFRQLRKIGKCFVYKSQRCSCSSEKTSKLFGVSHISFLLRFTKTKSTLSTTTLTNRTPTSSLPKKSKKMENFPFPRLFRKPQKQRTTNDSIHKTDAYPQTIRPIILQPDLAQSHDYKDSDETSKDLERVLQYELLRGLWESKDLGM